MIQPILLPVSRHIYKLKRVKSTSPTLAVYIKAALQIMLTIMHAEDVALNLFDRVLPKRKLPPPPVYVKACSMWKKKTLPLMQE